MNETGPAIFTPAKRRRGTGRAMALLLIASVAAELAGCSSIGPGTVSRDRFEYSAAIGDSWHRQALLNIVKMRYVETPIFVDVGQIVASYTLESGIGAGAEIDPSESNDDLAMLSGHASYSDRPTVTYTPLTGSRFVKSLMTPLPPASVLFVIDSGWPADAVMLLSVSSIAGLQNQRSTIGGTTAPDAGFLRAIHLMRRIQLAGGLTLRIEEDEQRRQTVFLRIPPVRVRAGAAGADAVAAAVANADADTDAAAAELRRLFGLEPGTDEVRIRFGRASDGGASVAMTTRSILQLMSTMAAQIEVPAEHLAEHRVPPGLAEASIATDATGSPGASDTADAASDMRVDGARMITIHCTAERPADAFAAVQYRQHWFWIDDRDLRSKRVFAFMMMLFTLSETGEREPLPLITIPTR